MNYTISNLSPAENEFVNIIYNIGCMSKWQATHILKEYFRMTSKEAFNLLESLRIHKYIEYNETTNTYIAGVKERKVYEKPDLKSVESFDICLDMIKDYEDLRFMSRSLNGYEFTFISNNKVYQTAHLRAQEIYKLNIYRQKYLESITLSSGKTNPQLGYISIFVISMDENIDTILDLFESMNVNFPHEIVHITGIDENGKHTYDWYENSSFSDC